MAEDNQANDDTDNGEEARQKRAKDFRKNILVLAVLALLLVGLSVGGTIVALKMFGAAPSATGEESLGEAEPVEPAKEPAIYYPLKPELIVTYLARGRHRYAQIGVTLMFRDEEVLNAVELHKPRIMNALNMVLSGQSYEDLQTAEGKELARLECLEKLQDIMEEEIGKPGIEQVLFTEFVMQ